MKQTLSPLFAAACIASFIAPAHAYQLTESVNISAFASQSLITSKQQGYATQDTIDSVSTDFRDIGANLTWSITPSLSLKAQASSRKSGDIDNGDVMLDYGFAQYSQVTDVGLVQLQAGRILTPHGAYNDVRDIPGAMAIALLPNLYLDQIRNIMASTDGVALRWNSRQTHGAVDARLYLGEREEQGDALESYVAPNASKFLDFSASKKRGAWINYLPNWDHNLSLTYSYLTWDVEGDVFLPNYPQFNQLDFASSRHLLSINYDWDRVSALVEVARSITDTETNLGSMESKNTQSYLELEWLVASEWSLASRYEYKLADSTERAPDPSPSIARVIGANWMISPNWQLQGFYSKNTGSGFNSRYAGQVYKDEWSVAGLKLNYFFR